MEIPVLILVFPMLGYVGAYKKQYYSHILWEKSSMLIEDTFLTASSITCSE